MTEMYIVDGMITVLVILAVVLPVLFFYMVWDNKDEKNRKKTKTLLDQRRKEFEEDCERAGKAMTESDERFKTLKDNGKRQVIKYTGLFSGENSPEK